MSRKAKLQCLKKLSNLMYEEFHYNDGDADDLLTILEDYIETIKNPIGTKFTFGKHRGYTIQEVTEIRGGKAYLRWLLEQDWFKEHKMYNECLECVVFKNKSTDKQRLRKKVSSYNSQDKKKGRYDAMNALTEDDMLEIINTVGVQCYWCDRETILNPEKIYSKNQLTLDRIDNDIGHTIDNCVISCFQCNMKRGDMSFDEYCQLKKKNK